jgi:hypothetical protein
VRVLDEDVYVFASANGVAAEVELDLALFRAASVYDEAHFPAGTFPRWGGKGQGAV